MENWIVKDILIIFVLSIPIVLALQKLRLPPMLGFLVCGALIGPHGLGWIVNKQEIDILAEIGVALLLFSVGLEFSFQNIGKMRRYSILSGVFQILLTVLAGLLIAKWLGWSAYRGLYFGCILALSSTAVVMTTLFDHRMVDSIPGRFSTIILILQDLALIPMIILLQWWGTQEVGGTWQSGAFEAGKVLLLILFAIVFTRSLANWVFRIILSSRSREVFIITVISLALGLSWLTQQMGLTFAIGAFLGGVIIGATDYKHQALSEIQPFRYAFNSLFFVSIGMLVDFQFIQDNYLLVLLLVVMIPLLKTLITTIVMSGIGISLRIAVVTGIYLGQIGEFSFLLAYIGNAAGVIEPFFYNLIITTAAIAMLMTPLMMAKAPGLAKEIIKWPLLKRLARSSKERRWQRKAKAMKDHVIICGFGPLGKALGKILKEHNLLYLVLDLNPDTIDQMSSEHDNVFFGDGASEEILYQSGIDRAQLLAITVPDFLNSIAIIEHARRINPDILIITRSKYRNEVEQYYEAGANIVISEELEGGVEMGRYALRELGVRQAEVDDYISKIREFGSADFF